MKLVRSVRPSTSELRLRYDSRDTAIDILWRDQWWLSFNSPVYAAWIIQEWDAAAET
jgi:hypothetical protein